MRTTVILLAAVATTSCATPMSSLRSENRRISDEIDELRADHRAQDRKIRDLEHQLEQQQQQPKLVPVTDVPQLPVVVMAPDVSQSRPADLDPDARVVGTTDDGAEVIYEGEAAAAPHTWIDDEPSPLPSRRPARIAPPMPAAVQPAPMPAHVALELPHSSERAPVAVLLPKSAREMVRERQVAIDAITDTALMDPAIEMDPAPARRTVHVSPPREAQLVAEIDEATPPAVPTPAPASIAHRNPFAFARSARVHTHTRESLVPDGSSVAAADPASVAAPAPAPSDDALRARRHHAHSRVAASESSPSAGAEYRTAVALVKAGKHRDGEAALRAFIKAHPHHDYADNAQYWIGQDYLAQKNYEQALVEFRATIEKFPRGNKVPDAFLKIGDCYAALGDADLSRAAFRDLIARFPRSESAAIATRRLEPQ